LNAGELVEPWYETLPLLVGSGKFVTPCARMYRANVRASLAGLDVSDLDADGVPLDPQAATETAQIHARPTQTNLDIHPLFRRRDHTTATAEPGS
jgi:hypothetical protein